MQSTVSVTAPDKTRLPAKLLKPDGDGPFPAVVIAHDCSGLGPKSSGSPMRWAHELVAQSYVILIPDSFAPRGFATGVCFLSPVESRMVTGPMRAGDERAALAFLRTLPYVDGQHIGLMGGSHGGWTTLATMATDAGSTQGRPDFAGAVALYPVCAAQLGTWSVRRSDRGRGPVERYVGVYRPSAPVLILIGEKDDWTPAEYCQHLADSSRANGLPVDIKVYPGAQHAFDSNAKVSFNPQRNNVNAPGGRGATIGGNPEAWADAKREVAAFFAAHLKQGR